MSRIKREPRSVEEIARERVADMQADWFIREVKRCREIGMPLGCCEDWPECSHVLVWIESGPDSLPGEAELRTWSPGDPLPLPSIDESELGTSQPKESERTQLVEGTLADGLDEPERCKCGALDAAAGGVSGEETP